MNNTYFTTNNPMSSCEWDSLTNYSAEQWDINRYCDCTSSYEISGFENVDNFEPLTLNGSPFTLKFGIYKPDPTTCWLLVDLPNEWSNGSIGFNENGFLMINENVSSNSFRGIADLQANYSQGIYETSNYCTCN